MSNIQPLVERARLVRDEIDALNKELNRLNKEKAECDRGLQAFLQEQGLDRMAVDGNVISLTEEDVATVNDWDALHALLVEKEALYVLHRRISVKPLLELVESMGVPPADLPVSFDKLTKVSFRRG
jgi:hypothetical protein